MGKLNLIVDVCEHLQHSGGCDLCLKRLQSTVQCWHEGQMVVVKAYSKRDVTQSLREQGERLENIRFAHDFLSSHLHVGEGAEFIPKILYVSVPFPFFLNLRAFSRQKLYRPSHTNVLPFIWFPETQRAAFLVSTKPWISYMYV
jgi:hypothetical protein